MLSSTDVAVEISVTLVKLVSAELVLVIMSLDVVVAEETAIVVELESRPQLAQSFVGDSWTGVQSSGVPSKTANTFRLLSVQKYMPECERTPPSTDQPETRELPPASA